MPVLCVAGLRYGYRCYCYVPGRALPSSFFLFLEGGLVYRSSRSLDSLDTHLVIGKDTWSPRFCSSTVSVWELVL